VDVLRLVNVALSVAAVAAIMAVAWLRALPRALTLAFGTAVLFNPVLPYLGGAINNDNLAILGGALTVLGAQWLTSRNTPGTGWALLIVGGALAALAKLTAGLMTGVFAVAFVAQRWRDQRWRERDARDWRWRDEKAAAALWLAVQAIACLPYGWYLLRYGSPTPLVESFIAEYRRIAELGTRLLGWRPQEVLSLPAYAGDFLIWLAANWNPVTGMHGWPQAVVLAGPAVVLMLAVPALGANLPPRRGADAVIGAGTVALPVMLLLHVLFSYRMYRETGSPPLDAVPRYYFPLALALVPLAACRTLARLPPAPRLVLVAAIPLVLAAALPVIARCAGGGCG
jgi:MFS family permease